MSVPDVVRLDLGNVKGVMLCGGRVFGFVLWLIVFRRV